MKLLELSPRWWALPGRHGQGVLFQCPCCVGEPLLVGRAVSLHNPAGRTRCELAVAFENPLDGGAPFPILNNRQLWEVLIWNVGNAEHPAIVPPGVHWNRKGDTFETLSLTPSVNAAASGHWHGHVTAGEIR